MYRDTPREIKRIIRKNIIKTEGKRRNNKFKKLRVLAQRRSRNRLVILSSRNRFR